MEYCHSCHLSSTSIVQNSQSRRRAETPQRTILDDELETYGERPIEEKSVLAWALLDAVLDVESRDMQFPDIKPSNVLLASEGLKLIDLDSKRHTRQYWGDPVSAAVKVHTRLLASTLLHPFKRLRDFSLRSRNWEEHLEQPDSKSALRDVLIPEPFAKGIKVAWDWSVPSVHALYDTLIRDHRSTGHHSLCVSEKSTQAFPSTNDDSLLSSPPNSLQPQLAELDLRRKQTCRGYTLGGRVDPRLRLIGAEIVIPVGVCQVADCNWFPYLARMPPGNRRSPSSITPDMPFLDTHPECDSSQSHVLKNGPLVLVALIYEGLGVVFAFLVKQFFWVPHRFRYGILVAGGWGNVGDIPTSVVMSLTASAPFNPKTDQNLAVAYISVFILVYMLTLFPLGTHRLIAKDFVGPDVEHEEVREKVRERRRLLLYYWPKALAQLRHRKSKSQDSDDPENQGSSVTVEKHTDSGNVEVMSENNTLRARATKYVSIVAEGQNHDGAPSEGIVSPTPTERITSPTATIIDNQLISERPAIKSDRSDEPVSRTSIAEKHPRLQKVCAELKDAIKSTLTPASLSILLSFPIALVPQLKGLFTETSGSGIPNAPDGQPPLAFILDFTSFMGAASVPMALIGLGSALARIQVPRDQWKDLPLGAIFSLAIVKLIVTPVLGVLITHGLVNGGVIDEDDKIIQFISMFFSCLPTATTQVFITQVYSGTGSAEFMSPFLPLQYFLMLLSMTALTAYSLNTLF
ncbi:hypothetical protein D9758_003080 [Tetrapyrgos nigripes]|uniref:Protein kinase domain-containing protein n=1 Tax=Tetrapyrgos nigripes TaxID=182062 RepID=A0A8H5GQ20_9AGAR|nr:hypothetical protein D9758_003080 [Tetrapyrgos nigripes]